ncbi:MAG: NAD-dependent epimerase/dehydratase family protein [Actinomycetota bacterium]
MLVTGAAGFIGSNLCGRLVAEGHEVVGFDDLSGGRLENLSGSPEVDLVVGDVRDRDAVLRAARGTGVIFHQGALPSVIRSIEAPGPTVEINVGGTLNVLIAAHEVGARVVAASSSSVYGDQVSLPVREDMEPRPKSPYAASKLAVEAFCHAWANAYRVPAVSLRYFNVYGPHQDPASEYAAVVPRFIRACLTRERPLIYGDGGQGRDFTYIDDVIEGNILASLAPEAAWGLAFNIGGGREPTSVNRLLWLIAEAAGARPDPIHTDPRPGDIRLSHADIRHAGLLLGYRPAVPITEGLRRTVDWFKSRLSG